MVGSPGNTLTETAAACRPPFCAIGLFSLCINLLMLTVPLYMLQVFDRVLVGRSEATLLYLTAIALGAVLVLGVLELIRSRMLVRLSVWVERRLSPEAFERSVAARLRARLYSTEVLRDLTQVRSFLASSGMFALFDAPWVPIYLCVIFLLHPIVGLVALAGAVLLFALALSNELLTRKPLSTANQASIKAMQRAEATARNAEAIDAMGMMRGAAVRWLATNERALGYQELASNRAGLVIATSKFLRLAVQLAVLAAGAFLALRQELTPGAMIAGSILTARALAPVEQAIGAWKQLVGARTAYGRLRGMFHEVALSRAKGIPLPPPQGRVSVEQVSFAYPGANRLSLREISFALEAGEALAIVGPSAAGKSTLARLLIGLWSPRTGTVRLDGADVYTWDREDFGRHVGYLPQDVELFAGTVRENIARLGDAPPTAIIEAAQMAGVHEMVLRLPQGYETEIGEGGVVLSGGQQQRVALARALLGKPRLLVLDEPNSNLDRDGEEALASAIVAVKASGGTVVMIAHRPSLLAHIDKILVLRDGKVDAFGARGDILRLIARPRPVPTADVNGGLLEADKARMGEAEA